MNKIFTEDCPATKELITDPGVPIAPAGAVMTAAATIPAAASDEAKQKGDAFAAEISFPLRLSSRRSLMDTRLLQ